MSSGSPEGGPPGGPESLRLCVIGRADSPHTRRWLEPLAARGVETHLIHVGAKPSTASWPEVRLVDLPAGFNLRWLRYPVWVTQARRALRTIRPHVLHAHCLDISGWVAAATAFRPLVVTVWGSDVLLHPERSLAARALARWVLRRADAVTVPVQELAECAARLSGRRDNIRVIHWGVDCRCFTPAGDPGAALQRLGIAPSTPLILSPRGLNPLYDPDTILSAMARIVRAIPGATLLMVDFQANPTHRQQVEERIRELDLGANVRILPAVADRGEMAELYRAAALVISHAHSDSLSLTVLEAMASATPVVVGDLPAYRGWVEDQVAGMRVPLGDARALADASLSILGSAEKGSEMGRRARRLVCRRASLERQVESALELYAERAVTGRRRTTGSC